MGNAGPVQPAADEKVRLTERLRGLFDMGGDTDVENRFLFRLTVLAVAMAMVVLGAGVALADYVVNNVETSNETVSISNGGSATVQYKITNQNNNAGDTQNNCNPGDTSAATVTINAPSGVTASPTSLVFTACDVFKSVQFSSSTAGSHSVTVTVSDAGGGVYDTSGATFTLAVAASSKSNQTITFDQPTSPRAFGSSFEINPTASSGLPVSLAATGGCTLSSPTAPSNVTMTSGTSACVLTASQAGNASYNAASNVQRTVSAQKANQATLTVTAPGSGQYGDKLTPAASGGSTSAATTFTATGTACNIPSAGEDVGKLLITSGTGTCDVTAHKAGDDNYNPVSSVAKSVTINKAAQAALSVTGPASGKYNETKTMTSSGGSGSGATTFEVRGPACTILSSGELKITSGTGNCEIRALKAADDNFSSATSDWHQVAVSKDSATLSISGLSHTYDGSTQGATVTTDPAGLSGVSVTYDGSATVPTQAGDYDVVATLDNPNYASEQATGTLVISPKQLTGSFTAGNKTYDGNRTATVAGTSLPGVITGDTVNLDVTNAQFDDKNVGTAKDVTADLALSGAQAVNYSLSSTSASTSADITKLDITGSFKTANKVYDGTTSAAATDRSLTGGIPNDDVSLTGGTASFDNKNVGTNKTVTLTGMTLGGTDAGNYNLTSVSTEQADITKLELTGSFTAGNKTYDGNTSATVSSKSLPGAIGSDDVTLSVTNANFDNKNVGTGKQVTGDLALTGAQAGNYSLSSGNATTSADITKLDITGSFKTANKVYDGTTDATATGRALAGTITSDSVSLSGGTAAFDNKNAGTNKTVTLTGMTLGGTDAGNYNLTSVSTEQADITARPITVTADAKSKAWGTADPELTYSLTSGSLVEGDSLTGELSRVTGTKVGTYAIEQNTLSAGSNYTITYIGANLTITPAFRISGFYAPVDGGGIVNTVKGGSTVPLKFEAFAGTVEQKDVGIVQPLLTKQSTCGSGGTDPVEVTATGGTSLRFDTSGDQFIYNWQTPRTTGACYTVTVELADGTKQSALFKIK